MKIKFMPLQAERTINNFISDKKVIDIVKLDETTMMIKYEDLIVEDRSRQGLFIPNEVLQGRFIVIDDGEVLNYGKSGKYEW